MTEPRLDEHLFALDTMAGDRGSQVQVEGAILALKEFGVRSLLVGKAEELRAHIEYLGATEYQLEIVDAPQVVGMDESPVKAVRRKPDSSLCRSFALLEEGRVSGVLSSGNSGAMMAAGKMITGLLPGIERPAIATIVPSGGKPGIMLDSGANVDCHARNLVQFAIMGSVYASTLTGSARPRVGLLSNGSESTKGTDIIRAASAELSKLRNLNYIGYVEGRDITTDVVDVIVCDGFVGNVALKTLEGGVKLVFSQILAQGKKSVTGKLGLWLAKSALKRVFLEDFDYTNYGGAPLLGLRKLAVVLHGSSDARAVKNALRVAHGFAQEKMTERIAGELVQFEDLFPEGELS